MTNTIKTEGQIEVLKNEKEALKVRQRSLKLVLKSQIDQESR